MRAASGRASHVSRPAVDPAPRLSEPACLRGRPRPDRSLRDGRHERDDAAHPVGGARPGPFGGVRRRRRQGRERDDAESAGRPGPPRGASAGRPASLRRQSAVQAADGLRSLDAHDQELRTSTRSRHALAAVWRREDDVSPAAHSLSALHGERERLLRGRRRNPLRLFRKRTRSGVSRNGRWA